MNRMLTLLVLSLLAVTAAADTIPGLTTGAVNFPVNASASALGPDGNLWFIDAKDNSIGKLTVDDRLTSYPIPTAKSQPYAMTAGQDGNIWFSEMIGPRGKIAKITPNGHLTEFSIPSTLQGGPWQMTAGCDGSVWFLEIIDGVHVGRFNADGTFNEFKAAGAQFIAGITAVPDGVWLVDPNAGVIMKMHSDGSIAESHPLPSPAPYSGAAAVVAPDGNVWFIYGTNAVNRLTPDGVVTAYSVPTSNANPAGVAVGPDGNIWFSEYSANQIGQLVVSTADAQGHATIHESPPVGKNLADVFFMPAQPAGGSSIVRTSSRGPAGSPAPLATDCLPPEGRVREDTSEYGNLVRLKFVPPSRCADLGIDQPNYSDSRGVGYSALAVNVPNFGKDDVTGGTVRISVFPTPLPKPPLLTCPSGSIKCTTGSPAICDGFGLPAFHSCTATVWMKPVPGLDDIIIVGISASSPLYDQNPANNSANIRIDTKTGGVDALPPDSNTPPVGQPVKRGH